MAARRVAVIGGGITGLAAVHRLGEIAPDLDVTLYESGERLGGIMQTEHRDGFCLELGPDSIITQERWGLDLCRRIGFSHELIGTNDSQRRIFVVKRGRLLELPPGLAIMAPQRIWPLVRSGILSLSGKFRLACEYFVPRRTEDSDESLAAFARRRFGEETFARLVQPLAAGIYMADPEQLSMQAAFAQFVEMEREHGSLIRAARHKSASRDEESGPRYSLFVAPKNGLHSLIEALTARLSKCRIETSTRIDRIEHNADGYWQVTCRRDESGGSSERFAGVILAVPAFAAAPMVEPVDESLAHELAGVPYEGALAVCLAFQRDQIAHPLDGFGFVVPQIEGRDVVACTFSSVKYAGRAPENSVLLRAFLGGALHSEALGWDDEQIAATTLRELNELLGIQGPPLFTRIARWKKAMPQYHLGHLQRVERIEESLRHWGTLQLAGNAYRGVGIPQCIHSAETAAQTLVARLGG